LPGTPDAMQIGYTLSSDEHGPRVPHGARPPAHEATNRVRCRAAELDEQLDDAISIAALEVVRRSYRLARVA